VGKFFLYQALPGRPSQGFEVAAALHHANAHAPCIVRPLITCLDMIDIDLPFYPQLTPDGAPMDRHPTAYIAARVAAFAAAHRRILLCAGCARRTARAAVQERVEVPGWCALCGRPSVFAVAGEVLVDATARRGRVWRGARRAA
jgi:hypothetical protein